MRNLHLAGNFFLALTNFILYRNPILDENGQLLHFPYKQGWLHLPVVAVDNALVLQDSND